MLQVAIEMSGGKILIGFQFRVHPRIRHIVKLLNEGEIGTPTSAKSHWGEFLPGGHPCEEYRASYSARGDLGGGVLVTLDYPFDYLRWLFGEICTESIIAGKYGEPDFAVEVAAAVIPSIRDKLICLLDLDYNQQPPSHWFRLSRIQGSIR